MAAKIELAKERLIAEVNRVVLIHEIELKRWKDKEAIRAKFDDERRRLFEVEIERLDVWYRSPAFVGSVAFGMAIVVIFAASAFSGAIQGTL